jgi:DNA invertase Pin-like site-specific DNA recombinase
MLASHGTFPRYLAGCLCDDCFSSARQVHAARLATTQPYRGGVTRAVAPYRHRRPRYVATQDERDQARALLDQGMRQAEVSRQTGLSYVTVHRIAKTL